MNKLELMENNVLIGEAASAMQYKPYTCIYPDFDYLLSLSEDELCKFILSEWLDRHLDNNGWF